MYESISRSFSWHAARTRYGTTGQGRDRGITRVRESTGRTLPSAET